MDNRDLYHCDGRVALEYLCIFNERWFQNDETVYKTFLNILTMYQKGKKSVLQVYRKMEKLLHAHQDLLEEFKSFLPNVTARPSSGETCIRYSHKEIMVNKEKPVTLQVNFRQSTNVKDERTSMEVENEQWKKVEKEKDKREDCGRQEKVRGEERSPHSRKRKERVRYGHPHDRKCTRRSDESILKQTQTGPVGGCSRKESLRTTTIKDSNSLRIADVDTLEEGCTKLLKLENCKELDKENGRRRAEDQESHWERDKDPHYRAKDILNKHASPNKEEYCTPSYRLLPKNYKESVASYRTGLAAEALNDDCEFVRKGLVVQDWLAMLNGFQTLPRAVYNLLRCEVYQLIGVQPS